MYSHQDTELRLYRQRGLVSEKKFLQEARLKADTGGLQRVMDSINAYHFYIGRKWFPVLEFEDTWLHSPKFLCLLIDSMHVPYSMPNSQVPSYNDISQCTMCNYVHALMPCMFSLIDRYTAMLSGAYGDNLE